MNIVIINIYKVHTFHTVWFLHIFWCYRHMINWGERYNLLPLLSAKRLHQQVFTPIADFLQKYSHQSSRWSYLELVPGCVAPLVGGFLITDRGLWREELAFCVTSCSILFRMATSSPFLSFCCWITCAFLGAMILPKVKITKYITQKAVTSIINTSISLRGEQQHHRQHAGVTLLTCFVYENSVELGPVTQLVLCLLIARNH